MPLVLPLVLALGALGSPVCRAVEELPTLQVVTPAGLKVLKKVKILEAKPDGLRLSHEDGAGTIPYNQLPADLRKKYEPATPDMPAAPAKADPAKKEPAPAAEEDDTFTLKPTDGPQDAKEAAPKTRGVVLIEGEGGSATGFVVQVGETQYIYTAVHVLTGIDKPVFRTPQGQVLPVNSQSSLEISEDPEIPDVARIRLPKAGEVPTDYTLAKDVPALRAAIQSPGNSAGEGVMTLESGEVAGVGPGEIEISNNVVPGNSGGPIVLEGTGTVVGLVTRASKEKMGTLWTKDTRFSEVRRFAAIPSKVTRWSPMPLEVPRNQVKRLETFRADSRAVASVLFLTCAPDGISPTLHTEGDFNVKKVLEAASARPVGQSISAAIAEVNRRLLKDTGSRKAESTMKTAYAAFFTSIRQVCNTGMTSVNPDDYIRILRPYAAHEGKLRKAVVADIVAPEPKVVSFDFIRR